MEGHANIPGMNTATINVASENIKDNRPLLEVVVDNVTINARTIGSDIVQIRHAVRSVRLGLAEKVFGEMPEPLPPAEPSDMPEKTERGASMMTHVETMSNEMSKNDRSICDLKLEIEDLIKLLSRIA